MTIHLHEGQRVVYQTDADNFYIGKAAADPDPQNPGKWLIPAGCVEAAPPVIPRGKMAQWAGYKWKLISV
jgi:hypothetical protein